jgi:hypothetical protein
VQLQAETNTPCEHIADFRTITTLLDTTLHPPLLVYYSALNNAIPDSLANDVLRVFLGIQVELDTNIPERNARV